MFFQVILVFLNDYESHLPVIWHGCVNGLILTSNREIFFKYALKNLELFFHKT